MKTTEHNPKTPSTATGLFALLRGSLHAKGTGAPKAARGIGAPSPTPAFATLATIAATLLAGAALAAGLTAALPATAAAYATPEGPPIFSSAPGLPDNRVWEQVSPTDKNGNSAGAAPATYNAVGEQRYALAAPDGNSVLFEATGPIGEVATPLDQYFVASKNTSAAGWSTRAVTPAPQQGVNPHVLAHSVGSLDPSADLSHVMFDAGGKYALSGSSPCGEAPDGGLYLSGPDPFAPATLLNTPEIEECVLGGGGDPVGGTPDFSTVYFAYSGTLLPEDAERAPGVLGFYEDREGVLHEAGVLPDKSLSEFGAVPATSGHGRNPHGNEVSADGSRAFFVSPDPAAVGSCVSAEEGRGASAAQAAAACAPQLYVRENGERTVLVSRDTLLPESGGLPASAPGGVLAMPNQARQDGIGQGNGGGFHASYVFASPDGSQAFFQSTSALTRPAEEASPGTGPKTYDFDLSTGTLTYLSGVVLGEILATGSDGSTIAFVRPAAGSSPAELDLWSAGVDGGTVTPITQLPGAPSSGYEHAQYVSEAQMSSDGSVVVFETAALIAGFNNGGTHHGFRGEPGLGSIQIYRYDVPGKTLGCISCPPHGITPSGNAEISQLRQSEEEGFGALLGNIVGEVDGSAVSADGSRIFFDTPDPLVPQDTDTASTLTATKLEGAPHIKQGYDVYEWENGVLYLISSGKSPLNSFFLASSANGDDAFFATAESLVPGDTDGAYDVYDARVPQPGDNPPAAAVLCEGAVCQGPPNVPAPLTPPASTTFSGLGNSTPEVTPPPPPKKTTTKTLKCKRGFTKKNNKCTKNRKKTKAKKASNKRGAKS